jgi:hemin uptake protein HemP
VAAARFWNNLHKVRPNENAKAKTKRNKHHRQLKSNGYFQVSNGIVRNN